MKQSIRFSIGNFLRLPSFVCLLAMMISLSISTASGQAMGDYGSTAGPGTGASATATVSGQAVKGFTSLVGGSSYVSGQIYVRVSGSTAGSVTFAATVTTGAITAIPTTVIQGANFGLQGTITTTIIPFNQWNTAASWVICATNGTWSGATPASVAPIAGKSVWIFAGHGISLASTAGVCTNLDVQGYLATSIALSPSGTFNVGSTGVVDINTGTMTITGATTISGVVTAGNNVTCNSDLTINNGGVLQGNNTAGGTVQTLLFAGTTLTVNSTGRLGSSVAGYIGESFRLFMNNSGTMTITGGGYIGIARIQFASAAPGTGANQTVVIDNNIEIRSNNSVAGVGAFNIAPTASGANTKTLTINAGKIVNFAYANGAFLGYQSPSLVAWNGIACGNITININGTLDCSIGQFNVNTTTANAQTITFNIGGAGILKLGQIVRLYQAASGHIYFNVADGGIVDASATAFPTTPNGALTNTSVPTTTATATIITATGMVTGFTGGTGGTSYTKCCCWV